MMRDGLGEMELLLLDSGRRIGYRLQTQLMILHDVCGKWELCPQCN